MDITKREVLFSIVIIALMLLFGVVIHGNINDSLMLEQQEYNTALKIDNDKDLFEYGMRTNIGNAFVYGELKAIDTVTYPEIGGAYSKVVKIKERYTMHTRVVTKTRMVNGHSQTYTTTETYWTWDEVDRWSEHSNKISFLDVEFDYGKINFPSTHYIDTQHESGNVRYVYYGSDASYTGTLYAVLGDDTIDETKFYTATIDEVMEGLLSDWQIGLFWFLWIVLIITLVCLFYYLDNKWLEDKR